MFGMRGPSVLHAALHPVHCFSSVTRASPVFANECNNYLNIVVETPTLIDMIAPTTLKYKLNKERVAYLGFRDVTIPSLTSLALLRW